MMFGIPGGSRLILIVFLGSPIYGTEFTLVAPSPTPQSTQGISSNPANTSPGTGELQKLILDMTGIHDDHGVRVGGVWLGNSNWLMSGGAEPGNVSWNSAFITDLLVDLEKLTGWWKGADLGIQFLQFNGQNTNGAAGSVQGYNSLPGHRPLDRTELYQLWVFQRFLDDKVSVRVGKSLPNVDFGNVLEPVAITQTELIIPAVSGLLYTPVFVNPSMLGVIPGYYNSACGVTLGFYPVDWWFLKYGFFDGSLAAGIQTGLTGPHFNGYYFNIWETGLTWRVGPNKQPGKIAVGYWDQTGQLNGPNGISENGTSGIYLYGSQRLWYQHPGKDTSGISGFFQFGVNQSNTLPVNQYFGTGLTAFGLVPGRLKDSTGIGMSWAWLNPNVTNRSSELMFQTYYQANIWQSVYLEPAISYIPTPGASSSLGGAWASTLQMTILF